MLILLANSQYVTSQTNTFQLKRSPNINFSFNSVNDYISGVTFYGAMELNITAASNWELKVGAVTNVIDEWNNVVNYSSGGVEPSVSILELRFRNSNNTSLLSGFVPLSDISAPLIVIGDGSGGAGDIPCPGLGTNMPGSYTTSPGCYSFDVDLRIVPGMPATGIKGGVYQLTIEFLLMEVL